MFKKVLCFSLCVSTIIFSSHSDSENSIDRISFTGEKSRESLIEEYIKKVREVITLGENIQTVTGLGINDEAYILVAQYVLKKSENFLVINNQIQITLKAYEQSGEESLLEWGELKARADKNIATMYQLFPDIAYLNSDEFSN